jgi:hypothetical protein
MKRSAAVLASTLLALFIAPGAFAQKATPATPKAAEPAAPARWVVPLKGKATVEFIGTQPKKIGDELVTELKVKNVSSGPIALLRVDEYWYNKANQTVSAGSTRDTKPLMPNEIVELTIKCPYSKDINTNQFMFSHANGTVDPKSVKKFSGK